MSWRFALAVVLLVYSCVGRAAASPPTVVIYRETTGTETVRFTWKLEKKRDIHLAVVRNQTRFFNRFDPSGATLRWKQSTPRRNISAWREKNRIILKGRVDGRQVRKELIIDDAPWYQALTFCLRAFLQSDRPTADFWMIRPDSLDAVKLRAEKLQQESVTVGGRRFRAWNVEVRLCGPLSIFWHAHYWYRIGDGLFLKYRGVHGPPGTPPTRIELDSESG